MSAAKYVLLAVFVLAVSYPVRSQKVPRPCVPSPAAPEQVDLPALNVVQNLTLGPSYSCNWDASKGYGSTALFLSGYGRQLNAPELLFNGACGSADYFQVSTSGDDMSLIADLGSTPLTAVTAHSAFNLANVAAFANYTQFSLVAPIIQGHTYAVVANTRDVRAIFVFNVVKFVPDQQVDLQYTIKDYQINLGPFDRSPGFDWNK